MIRQFLKDTPNSVLFWNGIVVLLLIGAFLTREGALATILLTVFSLVLVLNGLGEGPGYDVIGYHWWAYLSPLVWLACLFGTVVWVLIRAGKLVNKFNKFLNK